MKRTLPALVGSVAATLVLTACGGGADDTATDPAPAAESSSTPEDSPTTEPSAEPEMIGDYAAYPHDDYTYDLEVQCFCPYFGQPVTVSVAGGEVTDAVWAKKSRDHAKGEAVTDEWLRLGINDLLEEAADPSYDRVDVQWPDGANHPDQIAIDRMTEATDDEITYVITNVQPA